MFDYESVAAIEGRKVLNGAFGVEKSGTPTPPATRLLRLIINMIPSNSAQLPIDGDIEIMPVGGEWLVATLGPRETMLWSSEDIKGCFHIFKLPEVWRPWMALSKPVAGPVLGRPAGTQCWLSVRVVPMGWLSAVGVVQHLNRRLLGAGAPGAAGLADATELRRDHEFPCRFHELPRQWWRVYVDNFDLAEVLQRDAAAAEKAA